MANHLCELPFANSGLLALATTRPGLGRPPSIFQVMPRAMYFGASRATSIDLCVRDLSLASTFRASTTILAEAIADPFEGLAILDLPQASRAATFTRANHVSRLARRFCPDVIVVQQHLPTAAAIAARLPRTPVILHAHNFQKDHRGASIAERTHRAFKKGRYRRLAGIIHVSQACADMFAEAWPDVDVPSCVVNNGLDFGEWAPRPIRHEEILYVGRCSPEKGVLEAAAATKAILSKYPFWRAQFILSAVEADPEYFRRVQDVLDADDRVLIKVQRPFSEVKAAFEAAAIALAPSHRPESFGRTALEAHAGGAALISSGAGGLAEVSEDCALMLPAVHDGEIARALDTLIRHRELRQKLARAGAERVRKMFSICTQAARFDAFCERLSVRDWESNSCGGYTNFN